MDFSGVFKEIADEKKKEEERRIVDKKKQYDREFDTIGVQIKNAYKMGHTVISIAPTTSKTARNALVGAGCIVKPIYKESQMTNNDVLVNYEIKLPQV